MRFRKLLLLFFSLSFTDVIAKSGFDSLNSISYVQGYIPPDSSFTNYKGGTFLLKSDLGWLLLGDGNGTVWKLENDTWKRIDDTYYAGYNFGSYPFVSGLNIYKYGGYGFWKSNGILTLFDLKKKEWEPVVLNREIPSMQRFAFFDNENQLLYQFGALKINQSVGNTTKMIDSLFVLDLAHNQWTAKGRINPVIEELNPAVFVSFNFAGRFRIVQR